MKAKLVKLKGSFSEWYYAIALVVPRDINKYSPTPEIMILQTPDVHYPKCMDSTPDDAKARAIYLRIIAGINQDQESHEKAHIAELDYAFEMREKS